MNTMQVNVPKILPSKWNSRWLEIDRAITNGLEASPTKRADIISVAYQLLDGKPNWGRESILRREGMDEADGGDEMVDDSHYVIVIAEIAMHEIVDEICKTDLTCNCLKGLQFSVVLKFVAEETVAT